MQIIHAIGLVNVMMKWWSNKGYVDNANGMVIASNSICAYPIHNTNNTSINNFIMHTNKLTTLIMCHSTIKYVYHTHCSTLCYNLLYLKVMYWVIITAYVIRIWCFAFKISYLNYENYPLNQSLLNDILLLIMLIN